MAIIATSGCKKAVQIPPPDNQVISNVIFEDDALATSALTGIYSQMMNKFSRYSAGYMTIYGGLYADELQNYFPGNDDEFCNNKLTESSHSLISSAFWNSLYNDIYSANACLEGVSSSQKLTPGVKNQIAGEALFIRAFGYFYLTNLFGNVPLITTTNYQHNSVMARTPLKNVQDQMLADLQVASALLPVGYASGTSGSGFRERPNKWAAVALQARIQLYLQNWQQAEELSDSVIESGLYGLPSDLTQVFIRNSKEAIWQLQPVNPTWNTWEGKTFLPATINAAPTYFLPTHILNVFDSSDLRKMNWINERYYDGQLIRYPAKYKVYGNGAPLTESYMVLRLAEMYLTRSEARAELNLLAVAEQDLNTIRSRAGLLPVSGLSKNALLEEIWKERQRELFAEWGHRWFDLKRTLRADSVLSVIKPFWTATDSLWPIPIDQLKANSSLTQNPGY